MTKKSQIVNWKEHHGQSFKQLLERANLDWKKLKIEITGGVILNFRYPLTPNFFLNSAKDDLKDGSARGLVNALTNAKRAIDCQTDSFLAAIGYSPKGLEKQLGKAVIEGLHGFTSNSDQPLKFLVLESLGIVTPLIVNRVRTIRHELEHQYKKPSTAAVRDAIDIASLYVSSCQGQMSPFLEDVHLGYGSFPHPYDGDLVLERSISISLNNNEPVYVDLHYLDIKRHENANIEFSPNDPHYLGLLRVLFAVRAEENIERAIAFAVESAGIQIEAGKIKIVSIDYS